MANSLYDNGRQSFLDQVTPIAWLADTIKVVLVRIGAGFYQVVLGSDKFLSIILAANRVATSAALTSKASTAGVASAANITLPAVSGGQVGAIVLFKDTGVDTSSPLIAYIDTATGLPLTPNGGDITIVWDTGVNKIFKL